jgi:hypothetical protein
LTAGLGVRVGPALTVPIGGLSRIAPAHLLAAE